MPRGTGPADEGCASPAQLGTRRPAAREIPYKFSIFVLFPGALDEAESRLDGI